MGAYQLLHLDRVPAHAVLHDSVELVKLGREKSAAGMVNAVLRKIQVAGHTAEGEAAPRLAHPEWMVERWVQRYGAERAQAICAWDQEPAGITLRLPQGSTDVDGIETEPGFLLSCARRAVRGDPGRSVAVQTRQVRIQDEASQLVAEIAAAVASQPKRVLDACAAPGGKTAILAERLPQAKITAVDVSPKRLQAMQRFLPEAISVRLRFEVADAAKLELKPEYDLVLCDVPCTGTGTMARNPEIRIRVSEPDLKRQHQRQAAILRAGLKGLNPGGRLVYSTCSLEPEENEDVVAEVLRVAPDFTIVPVAGILDRLAESGVVTAQGRDRLRSATVGNFLRTLPGIYPCDGFFAAVIEKQSSDPAEAAKTEGGCCRGKDLEDVAGDKWENGEGKNSCDGLVGDDAEPGCSAHEDDETAGACGEEGRGEFGLRKAAAQGRGECGGEWIGEQIAARGSDEMDKSGGAVGAEDRQADCAFAEIEDQGCCRGGGREEQAEQKDGEGLQGERDRCEP
jgi:16S rRNA (cytosine967-C5)-methyltransferase